MTPPRSERAWRALDLLRERVPGLSWHPTRVHHAIEDHPGVDPVLVAGRCADWITYSAGRVTDGPATFRTFLERAANEPVSTPDPEDLSVYDRFIS